MPRLVKFVDQLTNWYVRMNRKRLKVRLMAGKFFRSENTNVKKNLIRMEKNEYCNDSNHDRGDPHAYGGLGNSSLV
jgi:hypothetical protein